MYTDHVLRNRIHRVQSCHLKYSYIAIPLRIKTNPIKIKGMATKMRS